MTKKQYYCDDLLEYRDYAIFDLSKADKNIDDFKDEDEDIVLWEFDNYLVDETNSILNGEKVCELLNELADENKELKKQMNRLYNYFMDWHSDEMGGNQFSEMWDIVKESEEWEEKW